ncbi:hypothetical protein [Moraxella oblonga]|uniref:hypothetical protein n=1 Tax=Moraxella oblonga TaxID=200413 RepID=UPI00082AEE25|nr:hypothetical protein [Moraxella oblonga]
MSQNNDEHRDVATYFFGHPELFYSKVNIKQTAITAVVAIVAAILAYVCWFNPELIVSAGAGSAKETQFGILMTAVKWISPVVLLVSSAMILGGGVRTHYDKQSNGAISTDFLVKHISAEHQEVREWFLNGEFDKILALPVVSDYYNKDISTLTLAHNPTGKTFYAFCEYQFYDADNHGKLLGTVKTEKLVPKHISEPQYSALMPMVEANLKAIKEVSDAASKEKNIIVTPNLHS